MFEEIVKIISCSEIHINEKLITIIFPIIYKIGKEINFDRNELLIILNEVKNLINGSKSVIEELKKMGLDDEQIIVHKYSEYKIKQFKKYEKISCI